MIRNQVLLSAIFTALTLLATPAQAQNTINFGIAYSTALETNTENNPKPLFAFTAAPAFAAPEQNRPFQLFSRFDPLPSQNGLEFTTRLTLDNPLAAQRLAYDALAINSFGNSTQFYLGLGLELNADLRQNLFPGMRALVGWNGLERKTGMFLELQAFTSPFGPWNGSSSGLRVLVGWRVP